MLELLPILALTLIHFGVPLTYYLYLKTVWFKKPWNIKRDPSYKPKVTVIIPTYNEATFIESKLNDIARQTYPRGLLEVIIVDSGSSDDTLDAVKRWVEAHGDFRLVIVEEGVRRGMVYALNNALKYANGDIIVATDADSTWLSNKTLEDVTSWFSDPSIGAVTCSIKPASPGFTGIEEGYREFYNIIRVSESKAWSTPIFHGDLAAFRRELLEKIGGFPEDIGANDSPTATLIALQGYRSIAADNIWCLEPLPRRGYHKWRIRRAQHLIQHFIKTLKHITKAPRAFKPILIVESYLHLVNPWLLPIATTLLIINVIRGFTPALAILVTGIALLMYRPYRTWMVTQLYLMVATIRNIYTKEIIWEKQLKQITA